MALKRLGITEKKLMRTFTKDEKRGRKQMPKELREQIWNFWHENSTASTITTRPTKVKVNKIPNLQTDLQYHSVAENITNKRNIKMVNSPWLIANETYRILLSKFRDQYDSLVSMGTFLSLCPFYVRAPNSKDIEM